MPHVVNTPALGWGSPRSFLDEDEIAHTYKAQEEL